MTERNSIQRFDEWLSTEKTSFDNVIAYLALCLYMSFLLIPIIWMVATSFQSLSSIYSNSIIPDVSELTLTHWQTVLSNGKFRLYAFNSVLIAGATTIITIFIGSFAAYSLSKFDYSGREILLLLFISTQMFPGIILVLPFFEIMLFLELLDTRIGIILAHISFALPFAIWLMKGFFDDIPDALNEAAKMDGCSELEVLRHVVFPIATPGIAVAAFYTFIISWNDFLAVSVLSQSDQTHTLPLGLYLFQSQNVTNWGALMAASFITLLPAVILYSILQDKILKGFSAGGVTG